MLPRGQLREAMRMAIRFGDTKSLVSLKRIVFKRVMGRNTTLQWVEESSEKVNKL